MYMDRARGPTRDIFTQTLRGTLSTTTKLSSLTHFFTRGAYMLDHKRTTHSSICELSLLCQLQWVVDEAGQSKICTAKGMKDWKQRRRILSVRSRVATVAEQRESRHGEFHGRSTSVHATQLIGWNVPRAKT